MILKWISRAIIVTGLTATHIAFAADARDSVDHPLLTRFPGAEIRSYQEVGFDSAVMPGAAIEDADDPQNLLEVEGKVTRISYRIPGERSVLEVMRNYESALGAAGFETLFSCANQAECGADMMAFIALSGRMRPTGFGDAIFSDSAQRALLGRRIDDNGEVHVFLHVKEDVSNKLTLLYQQVVESAALQLDQVRVLQADELQQSLERQGHVAVPGVYFDTGLAEIKGESDAALLEMAKLLQDNDNLRVYVVGHTDNVGSLEANIALSEARAKAVVNALSVTHGIDASRLAAKGIASLAPVVSNVDESGRARNRRVEIVVQ